MRGVDQSGSLEGVGQRDAARNAEVPGRKEGALGKEAGGTHGKEAVEAGYRGREVEDRGKAVEEGHGRRAEADVGH